MREILFRGKRMDNGEWVTGTPFIFADRCKMIQAVAVHPDFVDEGNVYYSEGFPVDLETVGQFTGLHDKNGKRIFEGDILAIHAYTGTFYCKVCWAEVDGAWVGRIAGMASLGGILFNTREVVGNIHDNPELLEVK